HDATALQVRDRCAWRPGAYRLTGAACKANGPVEPGRAARNARLAARGPRDSPRLNHGEREPPVSWGGAPLGLNRLRMSRREVLPPADGGRVAVGQVIGQHLGRRRRSVGEERRRRPTGERKLAAPACLGDRLRRISKGELRRGAGPAPLAQKRLNDVI